MIQLFLDNNRIHISSDQQIKLSRENPSVTSSGDYTLDVSCPLSIYDNQKLFGSWQRIDCSKAIKNFSARLLVNNTCVLNGSAKITGISNEAVKLQLVGDRSEFNAIFGDMYIDELSLPYLTGSYDMSRSVPVKTSQGYGISDNAPVELDRNNPSWDTFVYSSVYNEAAGKVFNAFEAGMRDGQTEPYQSWSLRTPQFNLLFAIQSIFKAIGYNIDVTEYDVPPFNHIIIACCVFTNKMRTVLPHWTLKEFTNQVELFFNCSFVFSSSAMDVKMVHKGKDVIHNNVTLYNEDVFDIEIDEENTDTLNTKDLHYALSASDYHDSDFLDDEKLKNLPIKEYPSYDKMMEAYNAMTEYDKRAYLMKCPEGYFCTWKYMGAKDPKDSIEKFIHVNQFGDLIKDVDNDKIEIKICPVAIAESIPVRIFDWHSGKDLGRCYQSMPSMQGSEEIWQQHDDKPSVPNAEGEGTQIQNLINDEETSEKYVKADRIEVYFYDGQIQQAKEFEFTGKTIIVDADAVFTAYDHKNVRNIQHEKWSMNLNEDVSGVATIGNLHEGNSIINSQKYTINFLSDIIPNATDIFFINNKKFIAEKIEITFRNGKMSNLMTGYFYELT